MNYYASWCFIMTAVKKNTNSYRRLLSVTDLLRERRHLLVAFDVTHCGFFVFI